MLLLQSSAKNVQKAIRKSATFAKIFLMDVRKLDHKMVSVRSVERVSSCQAINVIPTSIKATNAI